MPVPFMDLSRTPPSTERLVRDAVLRVLDHKQFILGTEVTAFEALASRELEGASALGVSSGTDALLLGLMALRVPAGAEVLTTPFSFFATAGVVRRIGARPVFVDIELDHFGMDLAAVSSLPRSRFAAAIPVHLFGHALDLDPLVRWAEDSVPIMEDAAQAIGARDVHGRLAGLQGRLGTWSFFPTKNLGALGDAGLVATRDEELAARMKQLRAHGQSSQYRHEEIGGNFRIDALQAAALASTWPLLAEQNRQRRLNAAYYERRLGDLARRDDRFVLPKISAGHTVHQYVVRVGGGRRDQVQAGLREMGIGSMVYYPIPFHLQPCFKDLGYREGDFPRAEQAAAEVLALPIFPGLRPEEQDQVAAGIEKLLA